jgi:hypothetical protein
MFGRIACDASDKTVGRTVSEGYLRHEGRTMSGTEYSSRGCPSL